VKPGETAGPELAGPAGRRADVGLTEIDDSQRKSSRFDNLLCFEIILNGVRNMAKLEREFDFFLKNQETLVKKYRGKCIVIKNKKILGAYPDIPSAIAETSKKEEPGTFLVQTCEPGKAIFTQFFHSRVKAA